MSKSFSNTIPDHTVVSTTPSNSSESQPTVSKSKSDSNEPFKNWEDPGLYCVKWIPSIEGFNQFVKDYREIIGCSLGGTRISRYNYTDPTIAKVLSVGLYDNRSSLPQRISLSNFKIGTPITSFGGIYRYSGEHEPEYLLIKRNDSVSYIDLVRGNYRESQLFFMIQDLPLIERERLLAYANDYDTLWVDLHMKPAEGDVYEFGKEAFVKISPYLSKLFEKIAPLDPDGKFLWLFPKGRPDWSTTADSSSIDDSDGQLSPANKFNRTLVPESPFECALREFKEETNGIDLLTTNESQLVFPEPLVERYLGSNSKNYQTNYFVFQTNTKPEITQFSTVDTPIRQISTGEVSVIKWVPLSELSNYLRPSRVELINYIETYLPDTSPPEINPVWKYPAEINDFLVEGTY
ncbi:hypothetical protein BH23THE1_BH23THE1_34130 [soil metagenome]